MRQWKLLSPNFSTCLYVINLLQWQKFTFILRREYKENSTCKIRQWKTKWNSGCESI